MINPCLEPATVNGTSILRDSGICGAHGTCELLSPGNYSCKCAKDYKGNHCHESKWWNLCTVLVFPVWYDIQPAHCSVNDGDDHYKCREVHCLCPNFCIFCVKKSITVVTTAVRMEQVVWMVLSHTLVFALMAGKGLIACKVSIYPGYFLWEWVSTAIEIPSYRKIPKIRPYMYKPLQI